VAQVFEGGAQDGAIQFEAVVGVGISSMAWWELARQDGTGTNGPVSDQSRELGAPPAMVHSISRADAGRHYGGSGGLGYFRLRRGSSVAIDSANDLLTAIASRGFQANFVDSNLLITLFSLCLDVFQLYFALSGGIEAFENKPG
jgi:hypothetical protein